MDELEDLLEDNRYFLLRQLQEHSASPRELVLVYDDVLKALDQLANLGVTLFGWEGWLRFKNGEFGHSVQHQGMSDLSQLSTDETYAICRKTIVKAQTEHWLNPEVPETELLFCIDFEVGDELDAQRKYSGN
jgi:hypothetical protein